MRVGSVLLNVFRHLIFIPVMHTSVYLGFIIFIYKISEVYMKNMLKSGSI